MIVRMSQAAARRKREDWLMLAQVIAIGTGSGFSGKMEPIQDLAAALGLPYPGSAEPAAGSELRDIMAKHLAPRGGSGWRPST